MIEDYSSSTANEKITNTPRCITNSLFIIFSIILYPEVLSNGEDKDYFLKVRKKLKEKIENGENIKMIDVLKNTSGFEQVFEKIKNNFNAPEIF